MANGMIISKAKNKIVKEFINDEEILNAIGSTTIDLNHSEKFIYTHIFDFNKNPYTLKDVMTFITVQVSIPDTYFRSKPFIKPNIEIWIISHEEHMKVDNVPKVRMNRNDYLSVLIDKKLNGRTDFGLGEINLIQNIEGSFTSDYVYRKMIFQGTDINESMCVDE